MLGLYFDLKGACMQELEHSYLKTDRSFIDNVSVNDALPPSDHHQLEQLAHLGQWASLRMRIAPAPPSPPQETTSFFLFRIDSLHNLPFRRLQKTSRVHAIVSGAIVVCGKGLGQEKCTSAVKVLEETSLYLFQLRESLYFYCYSQREEELSIRVEVSVVEECLDVVNNEGKGLFGAPETVGVLEVGLSRQLRARERRQLVPLGSFSQPGEEEKKQGRGPFCQVLLNKSESYRYLQWLIGPDTLCDCNDRIPGVMGGFLPVNQHALSDFAITPDAQGLRIIFPHIEISSVLLREAEARSLVFTRTIFGGASKTTISDKEYFLEAYFDNGWKAVSQGESPLRQKENHVPLDQSGVSIHPKHSNKQFRKKAVKVVKNQRVCFQTEKPVDLGLTFPGEEQCALILQVFVSFTITAEYTTGEKDKKEVDVVKEKRQFPVCFAMLSGKGVGLHRVQTLQFSCGSVSSNSQLVEALGKQFVQSSGVGRQRKEEEKMSLHRSVQTVSNMTTLSLKKEGELGSVEVELHIREQELATSLVNASLPLENMSSFNVSKVELKDKINAEKERMIKESKKAVLLHKKMGIELYARAQLSQQQKAEVLLLKMGRNMARSIHKKQALLDYLGQHIQLPLQPKGRAKEQSEVGPRECSQAEATYHSLKLSEAGQRSGFELMRLPQSLYQLQSNREFSGESLFLFEETPIEIIRTELSEIKYSNCYFFNFETVVPTLHAQPVRFPQVFFFKMQFWILPPLRSRLMTVNRDTGQLTLLPTQGQQESSKIMHLEVEFDEELDSYEQNFIHFVQYLYNGLLEIEMRDYLTGFSFGFFRMPLRNLIRKRRTEVSLTHEDYLYHHNYTRGKVKLEVKAVRKMKQKQRIQSKGPKAQASMLAQLEKEDNSESVDREDAERERILQRIQRFKEGRGKREVEGKRKFQVRLGEQQEGDQIRQIDNLYNQRFMLGRKQLRVSPLKKYFFFLQVQNSSDVAVSYRLAINDEDQPWIRGNPLSSGEEVGLVRDFSLLQRREREKLLSVKRFVDKVDRSCKVGEDDVIRLGAKEKKTLLLCYLSIRRFRREGGGPKQETKGFSLFNRQRDITCSLLNSSAGTVQALFNIHVVPLPEEFCLEIDILRPESEKSLVHLPFFDPLYLPQNLDQVFSDNPYVQLFSASSDSKGKVLERGCLLEISEGVSNQRQKEIGLLLVNNTAEKERMSGKSLKVGSRSQVRHRVEVAEPYFGGPPTISLTLRVLGAEKVEVRADLWVEQEITFRLEMHRFSHLLTTNFFFVLSQNADMVFPFKSATFNSQQPQLFKTPQGEESINLHLRVTALRTGQSFVGLNVVEGKEVAAQQEAMAEGCFRQILPLYRLVVSLEGKVPQLRETLKINICRANQQKVIEEPFAYRSSCPKKTDFKVLSSDPSLVWAKGGEGVFQLEAKGERKVKLLFGLENILRGEEAGGVGRLILGVRWDRGIDYFGLRFNFYD